MPAKKTNIPKIAEAESTKKEETNQASSVPVNTAPVSNGQTASGFSQWGLTGALWEYWIDAIQRSTLFWDVLRQRGDNTQQLAAAQNPPLLVFDYEVLINGKTLPRPVNYSLLRIIPKPGTKIDPKKRPIVVVDPRAGHGPGIGGSKMDSEIGVALKGGHSVYFVSFSPTPQPGQILADITLAEEIFLEEVIKRHPDAPRPCVYGNCQAGWAVAMLASIAPDLMGTVVLSGAPLSYWAGYGQQNAIRYLGAVWGGTWITSLLCDLGNGKFDGANLVSNFENLNPANTLWTKSYNLYANVDSEHQRYLDFEKWWNGFFLMNAQEMEFIVENLFIGNRLASNEIDLAGHPVRLKDIKAPIVVFASHGDNITPPQQALNWIIDVYGNDESIIEDDQVIVYTLHENIGHLGIFVGGKVAKKEHNIIMGTVEFIEMLPPGLYELKIVDTPTNAPDDQDTIPDYTITFARRKLDDIRSLDDTREDEAAFANLAKVSEVNQKVYNNLFRPWVRMFANEQTANYMRQMHPLRQQNTVISSRNPWFVAVSQMADYYRQQRRPVSNDNPFLKMEEMMSNNIVASLNLYRDWRDKMAERWFQSFYGSGWLGRYFKETEKKQSSNYKSPAEVKFQEMRDQLFQMMAHGGFAEAVSRMLVLLGEADLEDDPGALIRSWHVLTTDPRLKGYNTEQIKDIGKQQFFMIYLDRAKAMETLSQLLPETADRKEALELVKQTIIDGRAPSAPEQAVIEQLEKALKLA
jgi:poly(3-hydroxyalkanoate) synthetase